MRAPEIAPFAILAPSNVLKPSMSIVGSLKRNAMMTAELAAAVAYPARRKLLTRSALPKDNIATIGPTR